MDAIVDRSIGVFVGAKPGKVEVGGSVTGSSLGFPDGGWEVGKSGLDDDDVVFVSRRGRRLVEIVMVLGLFMLRCGATFGIIPPLRVIIPHSPFPVSHARAKHPRQSLQPGNAAIPHSTDLGFQSSNMQLA